MAVTCPICGGSDVVAVAEHQEFEGYPIHGCTACGTGFCHPKPSEAELADYYRRRYRAARKLAPNARYLKMHRSRAAAQARFVEERFGRSFAGARVLEIGCSAGGLLEEFRRRGADVKGIEPDESMAEYARGELGLDVVTGVYARGDFEDGPRYDLICLSHVVEHLVDPILMLRSLAGLLTPEGTIFVEVPNDSFEKTRLMAEIGQTSAHLTFFTVPAMRMTLEQAGLGSVTAASCGAPAAGLLRNLHERRDGSLLGRRLRSVWRRLRGEVVDHYSNNRYLDVCYDDPAAGVAIRALARRTG